MSRTPYKNMSHATSTEWDRLSTQSYLRGVEVKAMKLIAEYSVVSVKIDVNRRVGGQTGVDPLRR